MTALPLFRRYLLAGLVVTVPVGVTLYVLTAVFRWLREHIGGRVEQLLPAQYLSGWAGHWLLPVLVGLLLTVSLLVVVGMISSTVIGRRAVRLGERIVQHTPLVGWIYGPARQVVQLVFSADKAAFRRVVLVPCPVPGTYALGFVTSEGMAMTRERLGRDYVHVLLPSTPTPVTGILLLVPRDEVVDLPLTIEQGLKMVISGGVLTPENMAVATGDD